MKIVMGMCKWAFYQLGLSNRQLAIHLVKKNWRKCALTYAVDLIWYFPNSISVNGGPYHEMNHGVNDVGPNIGTKTPTSPYPLVPNVTRKHY
jgi:hypothetical protein